MNYLYTYLPRLNTALTEGILSTLKSPSGWLKYKARSGKNTRLLIMLYLNSLLPNRSKAFSAFSSPIPDSAHLDFVLFAKNKLLYKVKLALLLRDKRILSIYKTSDKGKLTLMVNSILKTLWKNKKPGKFLFSKVPHYIVAVKDGVVPPKYIKKQAGLLPYMSFPLLLILSLKYRVYNNRPIYTTRVGKDFRYKKGDIVKSPITDKALKITNLKILKDINRHPYIKYLTLEQKEFIKKHKKYKVLLLMLASIADNPIYHQTAGIDLNRVRISDIIKYINNNKIKAKKLDLQKLKVLDLKIDNIWGNSIYKLAPVLSIRLLVYNHIPRILKADTSYPIIYNKSNGTILDGVHRVINKLKQGKSDIDAYVLSAKDIKRIYK